MLQLSIISSQNADPGQKILDVISNLSVWLTDQNGELLNLRGEQLTVRLHLLERYRYVCTVQSKRI